ncbi:hypothetical protein [Pedobacter cryoconitis]|uniref:hypothetical protein n=1 Tax=Pedobacter cryoconitis TaxID=188932 RepID=UPI0011B94477|nr:hypothetical protein [Pedobacter cryoconitis]
MQNTVESADIIFSLTSPKNSVELAENIVICLQNSSNRPLYADLNSNTASLALYIDKLLLPMDIPFLNGAVMGASKDVPDTAVFILPAPI